MGSLNRALLEAMRCPRCEAFMKFRVFACVQGHSICDVCHDEENCPVCDEEITDVRNYTLEQIMELVRYPCPNQKSGCKEYMKLSEHHSHTQSCRFRPYICALDAHCTWVGSARDIVKHTLAQHEDKVLMGEENICMWKASKPQTETMLLIAHGVQFYVHRKERNGVMYWVVQYIGRGEDINLYYFEIKMYTDQYMNKKFSVSEICHDDVKDDIDELIETGLCIGVPMSVLQTYFNSHGAVFYKIKIKEA